MVVGVDGSQPAVGSRQIRRSASDTAALRLHLAPGYSPLQQVSTAHAGSTAVQ